MRKVTCLLVAMAAMAIALPAMAQTSSTTAQTSSGGIGVGNQQASQAQVPQPSDGDVNWKGVGIGAGTVAGNVLYVPAKLAYGILGGITGGASYLLTGGNTQTANTIWRSSLGGDYVLTPDMVAGQKPIHFSGPTMTTPPGPSTSVASPAAASSMNSTPPMPSDRTASAASVGGVGSAPVAASPTSPATSSTSATGSATVQPADRGTGPVSLGKGVSGGAAVPPLPGTSIE
jgi:hypothetical protein